MSTKLMYLQDGDRFLTWKMRRKLIPTKAKPIRDGNQWIDGLLVQPYFWISKLKHYRQINFTDEEEASEGLIS